MFEYIILLVLTVVTLSNSSSVPFINKCKSDDTKCAKNSAQAAISTFAAGLPELGVEQLDPVFFKTIDASKANLKFVLSDVTVTGLSKCQPRKIHRDVAKSKMYLKFLCDSKLEGQYEMGGQVLILPIQGKGKIYADLKKVSFSIEADMTEKTGADGKSHWHFKSWKKSYELKDKADLVFENLFNGNEVLGRAAKELIKNNGNDIVKEIGTPVIETVIDKIVECIEKFFLAAPPEDLSLD